MNTNKRKAAICIFLVLILLTMTACSSLSAKKPSGNSSKSGSPGAVGSVIPSDTAPSEKEASPKPEEPPATKTPELPTAPPDAETNRDYKDAYLAFLEVLASEKDKIEAYDWQFLERLNDPSYPSGKKQVALYDIIGDPTPELIFTKDNSKDGLEQAELCIYYYHEGSAIHVYSKDVDAIAGGGHKYALFIAENGELYYYESPGIEFPVNTLEKLELQGDSVGPALTYEAKAQTDDTFKYYLSLEEISEADFNKDMAAIKANIKAVLQYNYYQQFLNETELTKTVSFSYEDIVYRIKSAIKE